MAGGYESMVFAKNNPVAYVTRYKGYGVTTARLINFVALVIFLTS